MYSPLQLGRCTRSIVFIKPVELMGFSVESWVMSVCVMNNKIRSPEAAGLYCMRCYCECPDFCSEAEKRCV